MQVDDCPFRHDVRVEDSGESAVCALVTQLTGAPADRCRVARSACGVCSQSLLSTLAGTNEVISSTLLKVIADSLDHEGNTANDLSDLEQGAIRAVYGEQREIRIDVTFRCDVVLFCEDSTDGCERAIRSVLDQQDVFPVLHLFGLPAATAVMEKFDGHPDVVVHAPSELRSIFDAIQKLVPELRTPFVAVQSTTSVSRCDRLKSSLSAMREHGLDIVGCGVKTPRGIDTPTRPTEVFERTVPFAGLLFRRSTLIDMGGFSDHADADVELMFRAAIGGRRIGLLPEALVESFTDNVPLPVGQTPDYGDRSPRSLRNFGRGFPQQRVACDVVIPFLGQLDYVEEAIQSVVEQQDADAVIHLIDDASPLDTSRFLSRWESHPSVRVYRNKRNIGQFASFNNVFPYLETDLIAVQDGDDISLPHRLSVSGNALRLAEADLFGGSIALFGETEMAVAGADFRRAKVVAPTVRDSNYPHPSRSAYFIQNPTAIIRRVVFGELGGFADFGDRLRNRTGLDTEFQTRAHLAGVRVAVSTEVLVKYRVHAESATQDRISGWGTAPRTEAQLEISRRRQGYVQGEFDARAFGALKSFAGITERITNG